MHIGILQTGHSPDSMIEKHGDYGDMFPKLLAGHDFTFTCWSVVDNVFPDGVQDADGWLVTGSRHGTYEDHSWIAPLEDFIRAAYDAKVRLVGICFGHQIIAQALGGKVEKFAGGWAVGPQSYRFKNAMGEVQLNAWHQDQVTTRPADAEVVADNPFCANAALVYGDRAFTIQPHPEFGPEFIADLIEYRGRGLVPQAQLDAASANLKNPISTQAMADGIAEFFQRPRTPGS